MSTTTLPKALRTRLTTLGQRLHQQKIIRYSCRIALLLMSSALAVIVIDAIFGLPIWLRCLCLGGWIGAGFWEVRRFFREVLAEPIDAEGVACAVEQEYPRLSERLSTAVELAGCSDPANGSPQLIADVVADVEIRTRKLDLQRAAASQRTLGFGIATATALIVILLIIRFASGSGEQLRRFFIPFYTPGVAPTAIDYRVVVTSGDPTLKRGESTDLAGHLEALKAGAALPTSANLIVKSANGTQQHLPMEFNSETGVIHLKQGPIDAGFEYCIESGAVTSEWHRVSVTEPIRLEEIVATITPPAYALREGQAPIRVQGLGEIHVLQYSKISWDMKFSRVPGSVWIEWRPKAEEDKVPTTERTHLTIDALSRTTYQCVAAVDGELRLVVDAGKAGTTFPAQVIHIALDAPPKFEKVEGVLTEPRELRPEARLPIEVTVSDDIAVAQLELEYRIQQGAIQKIPLKFKGLGTMRVSDAIELDVPGMDKENQIFEYRLVATDNRNVPEANVTPQQTYYPSDVKWSEIRFNKNAKPLKEQDILAKKKEIDDRLQKMIRDLEAEKRSTFGLKVETAQKPKLSTEQASKLDDLSKQVRESGDNLKELANDIGLTPDLSELADEAGKVADRELKEADAALNQARKEDGAQARTKNLEKADSDLGQAIQRLEQLRKLNERTAQARLDREKLERIAGDEKKLKEELEGSKNDADQLARIKEKQKQLEEELNKVARESELAGQALKDALRERSDEAAKKAEALEKQQQDLNQAAEQTEKAGQEKNSGDLLQKQEELAKKIKELAEKTTSATRVGQVDPLKPENADNAASEIKNGRLDKAIEEQEKAVQELNRLARELEQAAQKSRDPRQAAEQLQRLQRDLKDRLDAATKNKPLELLTPEQKQKIQKEQEAIRKGAESLTVPQDANKAKDQVREAIEKTQEALKTDDKEAAQKGMEASAKALDRLAEQLPTQAKRLEQARGEVSKMKAEQEAIAKQAENAIANLGKKDPASPATQQELSKKLADLNRKQAEIAEKLAKLDTPGQDSRRERTQETLRKAQNDLADGLPQDIGTSQQAAKRELDRLEQALNGQIPADEKADLLAKKQKKIADELKKNAKEPNSAKTKELLQQQSEVQRELDKLPAPEAAAAQDDAQKLTRQTETALRENKLDEAAVQGQKSAEALQRLADQMNGRLSQKDQAGELAKKQKRNSEQAELAKKNPAALNDARKKAQQLQDELNALRAGADGQKDKQKAGDALKKAQQAKTPEELAKAEKDAEKALNDLADQLAQAPQKPENNEAGNPSRELAKKQRELANQTKEALARVQNEGNDKSKAAEEALKKAAEQQRELNKQAADLPATGPSQAQEHAKGLMNQAEQAADAKKGAETVQKQLEAADALDDLAKQAAQKSATKPAPGNQGTDSLPSAAQAEEAKKLAEEQRTLRDQAMKKSDDQARSDQKPKENPLAPLVKEQDAIAKKAEDLTKSIGQQQGETSQAMQQARQGAETAGEAAKQLKNGRLEQARESGRKTAQNLRKMAEMSPEGKSGKEAGDLAKRQEALNKKLEAVGDDHQAAQTQQGERQDELQGQINELEKQLGQLARQMKKQPGSASAGAKLEQGASHLEQAQKALKNAKQQSSQGKPDGARQSREDAARALELARQQAQEAGKQMEQQASKGKGDPKTGQSLQQARDQMENAQQEIGQGKPGEAGKSMDKAADSLKRAAQQIGKSKPSGQANPNEQSKNQGAGDATADLSPLQKVLEKYPGKSWGELPGKVQTDVIQEMAARYGEEYAQSIKFYFEQLAERK